MLTAADIAQLDRLTLAAAATAPPAAAGLRHARAGGYGIEVFDHRPYRPGDDPRLLDWNAEARLRQPTTRVLRAEGDARVHIILDASASMAAKWNHARRLAAAMVYLGDARRDAVGLTIVGEGDPVHLAAARHRANAAQIARTLDRPAAGRAELSSRMRMLAARIHAPAFVVVISDFFETGFGLDGLGALAARGLDPAAVQVLSTDETDPRVRDGDALTDVEAAGRALARVNDYKQRLREMTATVSTYCRSWGMPFAQLPDSVPFGEGLSLLMRNGFLAGRR